MMGLQHIQDVALIRHFYVRTLKQKEGMGRKLLIHLRRQATRQSWLVPGQMLFGPSVFMKRIVFGWFQRKRRIGF